MYSCNHMAVDEWWDQVIKRHKAHWNTYSRNEMKVCFATRRYRQLWFCDAMALVKKMRTSTLFMLAFSLNLLSSASSKVLTNCSTQDVFLFFGTVTLNQFRYDVSCSCWWQKVIRIVDPTLLTPGLRYSLNSPFWMHQMLWWGSWKDGRQRCASR